MGLVDDLERLDLLGRGDQVDDALLGRCGRDVRRAGTLVEVYNNSGIHGLAGRTSRRASGAGWQVVGSDNWYGTISASTVYYPARLHDAAKLLARDLGVHRLRPAIAPMRLDRLTVILTSDYA